MNFFQAQDNARRNTQWLVVLFITAVIGIIAVIYAAAEIAYTLYVQKSQDDFLAGASEFELFGFAINLDILEWSMFAVLAVVIGGSLFKILMLLGGGAAIAQSMGGRLVSHATNNKEERQLLNVVDEMAIAAGAPVPDVYILPSGDINAFAAGTHPHNAVIGVTRGAMRYLTRDQMQGVMAHEFSHIMNGDMRMNIRLIAILHGIMLLGFIGYMLIRSIGWGAGYGRRREGNTLIIALIAMALMIAGFVGSFFGSMIRASISRQREYLADAVAVQYTRNPESIAGALERIGQVSGMIDSPYQLGDAAANNYERASIAMAMTDDSAEPDKHAVEYSHIFFANPIIAASFSSPFATHPPLEKRIKRVLPNWSEENLINTSAPQNTAAPPPPPDSTSKTAAQRGAQRAQNSIEVYSRLFGGSEVAGFAAAAVGAQIGSLNTASIKRAGVIADKIPPSLRAATEDSYAARALIYTILLDKKDTTLRQIQLDIIEKNADEGVFDITQKLLLDINLLPPAAIFPLVQLALPALRLLSKQQYERFVSNTQALIEADRGWDLFEWCMQSIVIIALHERCTGERRSRVTGDKKTAMAYTLSVLARVSQSSPEAAFNQAVAKTTLSISYTDEPFEPEKLFKAMQILAGLSIKAKEQFAAAAANCAAFNGRIDVNEAALLRAYFMIIDCPLPLDAGE